MKGEIRRGGKFESVRTTGVNVLGVSFALDEVGDLVLGVLGTGPRPFGGVEPDTFFRRLEKAFGGVFFSSVFCLFTGGVAPGGPGIVICRFCGVVTFPTSFVNVLGEEGHETQSNLVQDRTFSFRAFTDLFQADLISCTRSIIAA